MQNDWLSPLDGRYYKPLLPLAQMCAPRAFAAARVRAEVAWLKTLATLKLPHFKPFSQKDLDCLDALPSLTEKDLQILTDIEQKGYKARPATNHDVKAVEYFIADKLDKAYHPWIHFALTSEDINSAAYAQILADALQEVLLPILEKLNQTLKVRARKDAAAVMLARTHGQPAVPTTFGKELRVFQARLDRQLAQLKKQQISCKFGGAVGAYNAHIAAFPHVNWTKAAHTWLAQLNKGRKVKLFLSPVATQIDNRDSYAELFDNLRRINVILLGLSRDMWQYIAAGLLKQKAVSGEVGSSTMPQKINPIEFENAEGNLALSNALLTFLSEKLPLSRLQRDLSDSTVLRNIPVVLGHCVLAYQSLLKGLSKITFDKSFARQQLQTHPEVLAEAYQTILRAAGISDAYEKVKALTRGQYVTPADLKMFIQNLHLDKQTTQKLLAIDVYSYIGLAIKLAGGKQ